MPKRLAYPNAAMARVVVYIADRKLRPPPVTFKYSAPAAIMLLGATLSLLRSVAEGQASVLVPIARMGFVVAALLGIFVLREPVTVRKMIGLVAALAGFGGAGQKLKRAGAFNLLLDHPIGTGKKNSWHDQAQRPRGLQVDDELKLVRMLNGKTPRHGAAKDFVDVACGTPEDIGHIDPVGEQAAAFRKISK